SHRLRIEREECCDDVAVAQCGNAVAYARTLAALEELRLAVPRAALGLGGGSLGERVRRLVAPGRDSASRWPAAVLVVLVLALALALPDVLRAALPGAAAVTASEEPALVTEPPAAVETADVRERPRGEGAMAKTNAWLAAGLAVAVSAAAEGQTGTWTISPASGKHEGARGPSVQLSMKMRSPSGGSWNNSSSIALSELRGLRAEQLDTDGDVRFQIVRDAGTFDLEGRFRRGSGAGHFTFTPNAEFARALAAMGYGAVDADQAFSLAVHDVSRKFIADLQALGYERVPLDSLVSLRIHGASAEFVREIKDLGYSVDVDQLVSFRIHGVSPGLVRALKDLGYERAQADDLVSLRIHGVTPEFIGQLRELGYEPPPPLDALVSMRIHGASTEFLRALRELGYERVPVDDLVSMRIHGVTPQFVRRANQRSGRQLPVERLVSMKIHGA
ncbi:MAG TPA: hypothetical protein VFO85_11110, partial [Vicinamibacteria bacterium]|nr:hypothetical protein [Vicinamibacteria bacterium]